MELEKKNYQILKTRNYLKLNKLFFFFNGTNKNSDKWLLVEQQLKSLGYYSYKITNRPMHRTLNKSIYINIKPIVNGITFLIKPSSNSYVLTKSIFKKNFEPLFFIILAVKLNNKIYSYPQIQKINTFEYKINKLILYKFSIKHTKNCYK